MGDETKTEKYYTIQIKGEAYRFKPLPDSAIERITLLSQMHVGGLKVFGGLSLFLKESAGEEQWDKLTDRFVSGEIGADEISVKLYEKLLKRQAKDDDTTGDDE